MSEFLEKWLGGHFHIGRLTVYGFNAMHLAVTFWTKRWGYVCFHPSLRFLGRFAPWHLRENPWYFFVSPNATPWASTFIAGPAKTKQDKAEAEWRRKSWGHGYSTRVHDPQKVDYADAIDKARLEG